MDATVAIAAMGFMSTLLGTGLAAYWQRRGNRALQVLDAKVRAYGDCIAHLNEYERATYNRVKARLASLPEAEREGLRQEAYEWNTRARAAIGQAAVLSDADTARKQLEVVRQAVGELNDALDKDDLKRRRDAIRAALGEALRSVRADLKR